MDNVADLLHEPTVAAPLTVVRAPAPVGPGLSIEMDKNVLHALVERTLPTVPARNVLPVLRHLYLSTPDSNTVQVRAAGIDRTFFTSTTLAVVCRAGSVLLPAARLGEILKRASEGTLTLTVMNGVAQIAVGSAAWHLRTYPELQFPPVPDLESAAWHDVDRAALLSAITTVRYAAARGDQITLMSLNLTHGRLTACDGSRFHQVTVPSAIELSEFRLPLNTVDDVLRLLGSAACPSVRVGLLDRHTVLRLGVNQLVLYRPSSRYPDVEQQLLRPALENKHTVTARRADLIDAVRRVRVTANTETHALRMELVADRLHLSTRDRDGNTATETVDVDWDQPGRQLTVHHTHLLELLTALSGDDVVFWLGTDTATRRSPLLVRTGEQSGERAVAVLQQMLGAR